MTLNENWQRLSAQPQTGTDLWSKPRKTLIGIEHLAPVSFTMKLVLNLQYKYLLFSRV